jgi:hypothetical protein
VQGRSDDDVLEPRLQSHFNVLGLARLPCLCVCAMRMWVWMRLRHVHVRACVLDSVQVLVYICISYESYCSDALASRHSFPAFGS